MDTYCILFIDYGNNNQWNNGKKYREKELMQHITDRQDEHSVAVPFSFGVLYFNRNPRFLLMGSILDSKMQAAIFIINHS